MSKIAIIMPSWERERAEERMQKWMDLAHDPARIRSVLVGPWWPSYWWDTRPLSPVEAMLAGTHQARGAGGRQGSDTRLFFFVHDDVVPLHEGWDTIVRDHFAATPNCALAGFGGALGLGTHDIYKTRYDLNQLVRLDYMSNVTDAERHGARVTQPRRVSVLDGFSLIFNDDLISVRYLWERCQVLGIPFHMYDAFAACWMARYGFETWYLPVRCFHEGGGTSVKHGDTYKQVVSRLGFRDEQHLFDAAHRTIYGEFRDVLPLRAT